MKYTLFRPYLCDIVQISILIVHLDNKLVITIFLRGYQRYTYHRNLVIINYLTLTLVAVYNIWICLYSLIFRVGESHRDA